MSYNILELLTISCSILEIGTLSKNINGWIERSPCKYVGSWRTDIGTLGQLLVLRQFENLSRQMEEREKLLLHPDPFGCGELIKGWKIETFRQFDFLPEIQPRELGKVYEFREYLVRPYGIKPSVDAWQGAIEAARPYSDHLITNMYGLDGAPRILHIWGFESFEQRLSLRAEHYKNGTWPPKNGPVQIDQARTMIAFPEKHSPLC
ncbi:NIPSNAP family protein [Martelella soudanensis]|uniref:NIPSNAP family protein n=1 Tax=unclassified Martelella TaxID=2629616 RepID=UPI0015DE4FFF|nr:MULTISPECIES: NIPSNAP family protein [unclassified Martelella]